LTSKVFVQALVSSDALGREVVDFVEEAEMRGQMLVDKDE